jgi:hypothetical protein
LTNFQGGALCASVSGSAASVHSGLCSRGIRRCNIRVRFTLRELLCDSPICVSLATHRRNKEARVVQAGAGKCGSGRKRHTLPVTEAVLFRTLQNFRFVNRIQTGLEINLSVLRHGGTLRVEIFNPESTHEGPAISNSPGFGDFQRYPQISPTQSLRPDRKPATRLCSPCELHSTTGKTPVDPHAVRKEL